MMMHRLSNFKSPIRPPDVQSILNNIDKAWLFRLMSSNNQWMLCVNNIHFYLYFNLQYMANSNGLIQFRLTRNIELEGSHFSYGFKAWSKSF